MSIVSLGFMTGASLDMGYRILFDANYSSISLSASRSRTQPRRLEHLARLIIRVGCPPRKEGKKKANRRPEMHRPLTSVSSNRRITDFSHEKISWLNFNLPFLLRSYSLIYTLRLRTTVVLRPMHMRKVVRLRVGWRKADNKPRSTRNGFDVDHNCTSSKPHQARAYSRQRRWPI